MRAAVLVTLGCLVVASSCKRKNERRSETSATSPNSPSESPSEVREAPVERTWVVPDVRLELIASRGQELPIDSTALARRVGSGLRDSKFFVADERDTPSGRQFALAMVLARVSYDVLDDEPSTPRAFVAFELVVLPDPAGEAGSELATKENVIVEKALSTKVADDEMVAVLTEQIELGIDLGVEGLLAKEAMRTSTPSELIEALARGDDLSFWALELIGERKIFSALDAVTSTLRGSNAELADASIAVLVALGEPAAVSALTEDVDFQDYERLRVIIEASSALGGEDAAEFLEFVASGHPDPTMKARAAEALAEVKERGRSGRASEPSVPELK